MTDNTSHLAGPLRLLPPELNTEIFKHAIWVDTHTIDHENQNYRLLPYLTTPLTLGSVCTSWRSFVWNTPPLWRIIILLLSKKRYDSQIDILELWLKNSKSCQLDIWFGNGWYCQYEPLVILPLQLLVAESLRWRKLSTLIAYTSFADVLVQVRGKIPLLQSCHLQWAFFDTFPGDPRNTVDRMEMFEDAPLLKHLSYSVRSSSYGFRHVAIPWSQLTSIRAKFIGEDEWITALSQCTNLIECTISVELSNKSPRPDVTINLPKLLSLTIEEPFFKHMEKTWNSIQCPRLRRLHFSDKCTWEIPVQDFQDFVVQSGCASALEHLHLENVSNISEVLPILEMLPSLQSLTVQWGFENDYVGSSERFVVNIKSFFASLLSKLDLNVNRSLTFLPSLQELRFETPPSSSQSFVPNLLYVPIPLPDLPSPPQPTCDNLLIVLQQRLNPPQGVSKMHTVVLVDILTLDESRDGDVIDALISLKREGMNVRITGL